MTRITIRHVFILWLAFCIIVMVCAAMPEQAAPISMRKGLEHKEKTLTPREPSLNGPRELIPIRFKNCVIY